MEAERKHLELELKAIVGETVVILNKENYQGGEN